MNKYLLISIISILLYSCASKKNLLYFQGEPIKNVKAQNFNIKIKKDDFLGIHVFGADENSLQLFNFPPLTSTTLNRGYSVGNPVSQGYLVDSKGEINFPVIGKLKVEGLNRSELIDLLQEKIKDYIKNPIILVQIQNFKITIIGEVRNPGTYTIPNERFTILEAIGLANDLLITGKRNNILVIRDEKGEKKEYLVDLRNKEIYNSPVYYLQQNDVIYVQPNQARINSSAAQFSYGIILSVTSLIITTVNILTK